MIVLCYPKMINERSETELTWNNVNSRQSGGGDSSCGDAVFVVSSHT